MRFWKGVTGVALLLWTGLFVCNVAWAISDLGGPTVSWLVGLAPYIATVDQSTVTTLAFVLTAWRTLNGILLLEAVRAGKRSRASIAAERFPFSRQFENLLIQLGLLGTIFGLIIAFSDLSGASDGTYQPSKILKPLGTALWSTFVGVGIAFLILPPIEYLFARAKRDTDHPAEPSAQVNELAASLATLGQESESTTRGLKGLKAGIESIDLAGAIRAIDDLKSSARDMEGRLDRLENVVTTLAEAVRDIAVPLKALSIEMPKTTAGLQQLTAEMRTSQQSLALHKAAIERLTAGVRQASTSLDSTTKEASRWNDAVQALPTPLGAVKDELALVRQEIRQLGASNVSVGRTIAGAARQIGRRPLMIVRFHRLFRRNGNGAGPSPPAQGMPS
jgi:methyl-accepting chemotaxis protein